MNNTMTIEQYYFNNFWDKYPVKNAVEIQSLSDIKALPDNSLDCLMITKLLNTEFNYEEVLLESKRKLKTGGILLSVTSSIAPSIGNETSLWGFTPGSLNYVFAKYFNSEKITIESYGNALAGRYLLNKIPALELSPEQLNKTDPFFPLVTGIKAIKE